MIPAGSEPCDCICHYDWRHNIRSENYRTSFVQRTIGLLVCVVVPVHRILRDCDNLPHAGSQLLVSLVFSRGNPRRGVLKVSGELPRVRQSATDA
jgi:hypothetical protein